MSLNVSLPPELEKRVREHVASGMYGSASEVIREALRLFEAHQRAQANKLAALRVEVGKGLEDVRAGRVGKADMEAIKAKGRAVLRQKRQKGD